MVAGRSSSGQVDAELSPHLTLEILQGRGKARQFPVRVLSLSSRGAILTSEHPSGKLNLEGVDGWESVIHLPQGETSEIRGTLLWARRREEEEGGMAFGLQFAAPSLKVRRALEEQLPEYPQDLKNLWDNWDAMQEYLETPHSGLAAGGGERPRAPLAQPPPSPQPAAPPVKKASPRSDQTFYWVGLGAVLGGVGFYYLAPESYRLFGVILAVYGSLTIAGKSVWSMWQSRA